MKKTYRKPELEVEQYTLDMSIASNCATVVSNGPAVDHHQQCDDYDDPFEGTDEFAFFRGPYNVSFYNDTATVCDCYYTSSGHGYWTS